MNVTRHTESASVARLAAMKLPEFASWLRDQPADRLWGDFPSSETCPIASYAGCRAAAHITGMPNWASTYIDLIDENEVTPYTQRQALDALEETLRRHSSDDEVSHGS